MKSSFAVSYALPEEPKSKKEPVWDRVKAAFNGPYIVLIVLIAIFLVSIIVKAILQEGGLLWLFTSNGAIKGELPKDIALALGPILALSLAIERLIETVFDMFETNVKEIAKQTSAGAKGLDYIKQITKLYTDEMFNAKAALEAAVNKPDTKPTEKTALISGVDQAEKRVKEVSVLWDNLPKDPKYISWKRAISIWMGLVIGMIVGVFTEKGFFFYLNLDVPRILDMLITGFVLGAGSGPLHSLIGILQSTKDTLSNLGSFTGVGALTNEVRSLRAEVDKASRGR